MEIRDQPVDGSPQPGNLRNRFEAVLRAWWPAIETLVHETISSACPTGSLLREMVDYHLGSGGKHLRAILPLLVAEAMGQDPRRLIPFGAACETLHNASLVHDDLQDGDEVRRGRLAVWRRFGAAQAINVGDALIASAFLLVQELDAAPVVRERVVRRMLLEMLRTTDGQVRDLDPSAGRCSNVADYLRTIEGKTARLFALPISGAAALCGADADLEQALSEAAGHIGVLYQVLDDMTDVMGGHADLAGSNGAMHGVRNLLIVHCLEHITAHEAEWFRQMLNQPRTAITDQDVARVKDLLARTGALDAARAEAFGRIDAALKVPAIRRFPPLVAMLEDACELFLRGAPAELMVGDRTCKEREMAV